MVITQDFVWLHFGKTAGTATRHALKALFPSAIGPDDDDPVKHANVADARALGWPIPQDLPIAVGFRSLRHWAQSHLVQQFGSAVDAAAKDATLRGQLVLGPASAARQLGLFEGIATIDGLLDYYCDGIVPHFIRLEFLRQDFQDFFAEAGLSIEPSALSIFDTPKHKRSSGPGFEFLNDGETALLYRHCPKWAQLEQKLYPNVHQPS